MQLQWKGRERWWQCGRTYRWGSLYHHHHHEGEKWEYGRTMIHTVYNLQLIQKVVVGLIILLLVVYTFYRLLHVWLHTLNFSEVKGLGGWDNSRFISIKAQPFTLVAKENVKLLTSEGCFRRAYKARKAGTFLSIGSLTGLECQGATVLAKLISTTFVLFLIRVKLGRRTERRRTQAEEEDEAQVDLSRFF